MAGNSFLHPPITFNITIGHRCDIPPPLAPEELKPSSSVDTLLMLEQYPLSVYMRADVILWWG